LCGGSNLGVMTSQPKFVSISEIDEDTRYLSLIKNYGIQTDAKLGYGDRGRGLFSTRDLEPGMQ
jgi:hypothetical protein